MMQVLYLTRSQFRWHRVPSISQDSNVSIGITGIAGPGGSTTNKEVGRVHVAVIAGDYFLSRRMDFGDNDRLDNKKSFAAFA